VPARGGACMQARTGRIESRKTRAMHIQDLVYRLGQVMGPALPGTLRARPAHQRLAARLDVGDVAQELPDHQLPPQGSEGVRRASKQLLISTTLQLHR
jgi:hypothetical protein